MFFHYLQMGNTISFFETTLIQENLLMINVKQRKVSVMIGISDLGSWMKNRKRNANYEL